MPNTLPGGLQVEALLSAVSEEGLIETFDAVTRQLGGTGFAVGSLPEPTRLIVHHTTGMSEWCEHLVGQGLLAKCAVAKRIAVSVTPFLWSDVREASQDHPEHIEVFRAAEDFGLHQGVVVPVRTGSGFKGNVFVAVDHATLTPELQRTLAVLALTFHSQLSVMQIKPVGEGHRMSERERSILGWFAEGKSAEDVAAIMGISVATVMFHYRNVSRRYGTLTRAHTIVESIRRGAISIS